MRRAGLVLIVLLCLIGVVAGAPPEWAETPSGAAAADRGPPWAEDQPLWKPVVVSVAAVLVVLGIAFLLYRRYLREQPEPVQVQTDEERVLALFDELEGDVKQKNITEQTGWSAAKVSRVTNRLEESGEIEKVRLGRENVLRRKDEEG